MLLDVFQEAVRALAQEEVVVLATVIGTSGSTPAPVHARMLVKDAGRTSLGTVGGGRVEQAIVVEARRLHPLRRGTLLSFSLDEAHPENDMLCGGNVEVLLEPLTRDDLPILTSLNTARSEGKDSILARVLGPDGMIQREFIGSPAGDLDRLRPLIAGGSMEAEAIVRDVFDRLRVRRLSVPRGELFLEPVGGTPELVVFGGGHIGQQVTRAAAGVGFRVLLVDDRSEVATAERFPEADQILVLDFATAFRNLSIRPSTSLVIVTRGHESDELVLEQALAAPACYIGMIGSRRKVRTTFEHLAARGISVEQLARVSAPIGMDIGAVTPEEIAISIVAELIRVRRQGPSRTGSMSHAASETLEGLRAQRTGDGGSLAIPSSSQGDGS